MNKANPDALLELAEQLWEEAEIRRLSSPWTSPTRFEGDVREHYIARARAQAIRANYRDMHGERKCND